MTTRTYDYKLTLAGAEHFVPGLMAIGNTSQTVGEIIAQDLSNNVIKVKVNNTSMQYQGLENIHCNLVQNYSIDAIQKYEESEIKKSLIELVSFNIKRTR